MMQILQNLSKFDANSNPDEIVKNLNDPFPEWTQGGTITQEMLDQHGELAIVICHASYRARPGYNAECHHRLSSRQTRYNYWSLRDYNHGILRDGGMFWFRSRKSYDLNPEQPF